MENLRERLTKKLIEEAFLEILNEGGFKAATVSAICERAQVNRSTFYRHFDNQYQLLEIIEQRLMADIDGQEMSAFLCTPSQSNLNTCLNITADSFRNMERNIDSYCILSSKIHPGFFEKFLETRRPLIIDALNANLSPRESAHVADFIIAGSSSIMRNWTCSESREEPEAVSELIIKMCQAAIASSMSAA